MIFQVAAYRYRLGIADTLAIDGSEVMGLCHEASRKISLSAKLPRKSRMAVLLHELCHSWIFATGQPGDVEGWCDLAASMAEAAIRDLSSQGGEQALQSLDAGESPQHGTMRIALTRNRYCGKCRRTVAGGSVQCHPSTKPGILDLSLTCSHCSLVQRWQEAAGANGLPSGTVVGEPTWEAEATTGERRIVYDDAA